MYRRTPTFAPASYASTQSTEEIIIMIWNWMAASVALSLKLCAPARAVHDRHGCTPRHSQVIECRIGARFRHLDTIVRRGQTVSCCVGGWSSSVAFGIALTDLGMRISRALPKDSRSGRAAHWCTSDIARTAARASRHASSCGSFAKRSD
jgi:hypothetical protein